MRRPGRDLHLPHMHEQCVDTPGLTRDADQPLGIRLSAFGSHHGGLTASQGTIGTKRINSGASFMCGLCALILGCLEARLRE